MSEVSRYYWDTCAFIGLINGEGDKIRELSIIYDNARAGRFKIYTSTLSSVECRRLDREKQEPKPLNESNEQIISELFLQPFIFAIPLTLDIAEQARILWRRTQGLGKWQDAVHVASALRHNIETMHTYDRADLIHLSEQFDCQNGNRLRIIFPDETTDGGLFAHAKQQLGQ